MDFLFWTRPRRIFIVGADCGGKHYDGDYKIPDETTKMLLNRWKRIKFEAPYLYPDTESQEMYDMADYLPITFMKRDPALANNKTDGHQMFMNEVNNYSDADIYVQLLCTSPFIHPETIDNAIRRLKSSDKYDSAILMKKDKFYFWKDGKPTYDINHIPNSKDLPETIIESMGLYIHKKDSALKTQKRYGEKPLLIFGSQEELIDVNTPEDLAFAEVYAKGQKKRRKQKTEFDQAFCVFFRPVGFAGQYALGKRNAVRRGHSRLEMQFAKSKDFRQSEYFKASRFKRRRRLSWYL